MREIYSKIDKLETKEDFDKIRLLPYLKNVIQETLRLHTPAV